MASDDYEINRLKNIAESRRILAEVGLLPSLPPSNGEFPGTCNSGFESVEECKVHCLTVRNKPGTDEFSQSAATESTERQKGRHSLRTKASDKFSQCYRRVDTFGAVPGVTVGKIWASRVECCTDGVHRESVRGIHGNSSTGCYSVALSGQYEDDDFDLGDCFIYTGEGGRPTVPTKNKGLRDKDQVMSKGNLALTQNIKNRLPVRVVRGYQLTSPYAPFVGYRYDGLYTVERFWECISPTGFRTFKFAFRRCGNQAPPPWASKMSHRVSESGYSSSETTFDSKPDVDLSSIEEDLEVSALACVAADIDTDDDDLEQLGAAFNYRKSTAAKNHIKNNVQTQPVNVSNDISKSDLKHRQTSNKRLSVNHNKIEVKETRTLNHHGRNSLNRHSKRVTNNHRKRDTRRKPHDNHYQGQNQQQDKLIISNKKLNRAIRTRKNAQKKQHSYVLRRLSR